MTYIIKKNVIIEEEKKNVINDASNVEAFCNAIINEYSEKEVPVNKKPELIETLNSFVDKHKGVINMGLMLLIAKVWSILGI